MVRSLTISLRSRQARRTSSSCGLSGRTIEHTLGSPRAQASSAREPRLAVQPIGFLLSLATRRGDRGGVDDVAGVTLRLQRPMQPEPVETGFLHDDDLVGFLRTRARSRL